VRYRLLLPRAFRWWLAVLPLAVFNGALRESILIPAFGPTAGLMASGILLCAFVVLIAAFLVRRQPRLTSGEALVAGAFWLALTLAFELAFGAAQGKSTAELLAPYRFEGGNLWPLVLLTLLLAPWAWSRRRQEAR